MRYLNDKSVKYIVVHCSATMPGQPCDARIIDHWHVARGFQMIGYHYVIMPDGEVQQGRPLYYQGAHVGKPRDYNPVSVGICYIGGLDSNGKPADTRTPQQQEAMLQLLRTLKTRFPNAKIVGHHDLNPGKACPCFNARELQMLL